MIYSSDLLHFYIYILAHRSCLPVVTTKTVEQCFFYLFTSLDQYKSIDWQLKNTDLQFLVFLITLKKTSCHKCANFFAKCAFSRPIIRLRNTDLNLVKLLPQYNCLQFLLLLLIKEKEQRLKFFSNDLHKVNTAGGTTF